MFKSTFPGKSVTGCAVLALLASTLVVTAACAAQGVASESAEKVSAPSGQEQMASVVAAERDRLRSELDRNGGWKGWCELLAPFLADAERHVAAAEAKNSDVAEGKTGHLLVANRVTGLGKLIEDIRALGESDGESAATWSSIATVRDVARQLSQRGVHLVVVPIPSKIEMYPEDFSDAVPEGVAVSPVRHAFMLQLPEDGVDVLDLYPALQAAKASKPVYLLTDNHWSSAGMLAAAEAVTERLLLLPEIAALLARSYTSKETVYEYEAPLVRLKIPDAEKKNYAAISDPGLQIFDEDGKLYLPRVHEDAPVLLMGDSYMMNRAGGTFAAYLAHSLQREVLGVAQAGGSLKGAQMLARLGGESITKRKVVVWFMTSRVFTSEWETVQLPEPPKEANSGATTDPIAPVATEKAAQVLDVLKSREGKPFAAGDPSVYFARYEVFANGWSNDRNAIPQIVSVIADFRDQLATMGIELVMVFPPPSAPLYPDLILGAPYDVHKDGRIDVHLQGLFGALAQQSIQQIDLLPEFLLHRYEEFEGRKYPLYMPNDSHWSPGGARLAAEIVAADIKRRSWYQELLDEHKTLTDPCSVTSRADMFTSKFIRDGVSVSGDAPIVYHAIDEPCADTLLAGKGESPITVLGDSFSLRYQEQNASFPQHLARELGIPVKLVAFPGGSVSSARIELARRDDWRHSRLVVWALTSSLLADAKQWKKIPLDPSGSLRLDRQLDHAITRSRGVVAHEKLVLYDKRPYEGIVMLPAENGPKSRHVAWRLQLGDAPKLSLCVALGPTQHGVEGGLRFMVRVDGQKVAAQKMLRPAKRYLSNWSAPWQIDLGPFANRDVMLELRADALDEGNMDRAYWAEIELRDGKLAAQG